MDGRPLFVRCVGCQTIDSIALCTRNAYTRLYQYGVATISRLLKIVGLFCKRALLKRRYSAKETNTLKEPANRSHPISMRATPLFVQCVGCQRIHSVPICRELDDKSLIEMHLVALMYAICRV